MIVERIQRWPLAARVGALIGLLSVFLVAPVLIYAGFAVAAVSEKAVASLIHRSPGLAVELPVYLLWIGFVFGVPTFTGYLLGCMVHRLRAMKRGA